jgi:hypothetical protein
MNRHKGGRPRRACAVRLCSSTWTTDRRLPPGGLPEPPGAHQAWDYLLEGGPDELISIRVFDSADEALASNETAGNWIRENVLEFMHDRSHGGQSLGC